MNLNHVHNFYSFIFILFYSSLHASAWTKYNYEERETFTKEFSVDEMSKVYLTHKDGIIDVKQTQATVASIEVELIVRGDVQADLQTIIQQYELDVRNNGHKIQVISNTNIKSRYQITTGWIFTKTRSGVKFYDGTEINSKVTDVIAKATLYLPMADLLSLEAKHHNITTENLSCDLEVVLYDGHLNTGNITGDLKLNLKHGSAYLGNYMDGEVELYDSKYTGGNGQSVKLDAKHSEFIMQDLSSIEMVIYDSDIELETVDSKMDVEEKHSKIKVDKFNSGKWETYDSKIEIGTAISVDITSKHGVIDIENIQDLTLDIYDSQYEIDEIGRLSGNDFKHSNIRIDLLESSLDVDDVYDTNIDVRTLSGSFKSVKYEGRNSRLDIEVENTSRYTLDVNIKHGSVYFPEDELDVKKYIEKQSIIELLATNGNLETTPTIRVIGNAVDLKIK